MKKIKILIKTEGEFFGYYKDYSIDIHRESPMVFYIIVQGDKGVAYDGYYHSNKIITMEDAIEEALRGSKI